MSWHADSELQPERRAPCQCCSPTDAYNLQAAMARTLMLGAAGVLALAGLALSAPVWVSRRVADEIRAPGQ